MTNYELRIKNEELKMKVLLKIKNEELKMKDYPLSPLERDCCANMGTSLVLTRALWLRKHV
jgi:hypothetical protein